MGKLGKKGIKLEDIIKLYNQGLPPVQIGEQLGCTHCNISRRLKKARILFKRDYSATRYSRRGRYYVDENFFSTIDNEASAYFLGLMYSDGSIHPNEKQFYIKLKDEDILQEFRTALQYEGPIRRREKPYSAYILQVSSKALCKSLILHGCTPNKTRTIRLPNIKKRLI